VAARASGWPQYGAAHRAASSSAMSVPFQVP
jgi:hypothetical protein